MISKKTVLFSLLFLSVKFLFAAEPAASYKLYGFVRNDLYFNSRQNTESLDGLFNMIPKPINADANGVDRNAVPNSQMLSISTRLGLDLTGTQILNAKSAAKIECDFAGFSTNYYVIRLRQAYLKLNWKNTELLVGQTWHPMFSNLQPITPALSVATPFQPFNRSPQIRLTQKLNDKISVLTSVSYQMQYMSQGPLGLSASYMKTGLLPGLHVGLDYKSKSVTAGFGLDGKSLLVNNVRLNSGAVVAYAGYSSKNLQVRAKTVYGQNLSEFQLIGGYGLSVDATTEKADYTNINTSTSWISVAYGSKIQVGIYGGIALNLGSNKNLQANTTAKYTVYGNGFYNDLQLQLDQLYRIAPHITYNLPNFRLGFEYELTAAQYGLIQANGRVSNIQNVANHRAMATISYIF